MALAVAGLASAAAAAYGAYSSSKTAAAARQQNALAQAVQRRQMELSEDQQRASLAPTTNARGDRSEYIPGVGWVETASPLTRAIQSRSDNEEARRLAQDMPRQAAQREVAYAVQQRDRGLANASLARSNIGTRSLADTEADAVRGGVAQAVAGRKQIGNAALLTALRSGTGAQDFLAAQGRNGQADTRVALEQARSAAPGQYAAGENGRVDQGLNRYQNLMGRALAPDQSVPFQPSQLADNLAALRQKQQGTAAYGMASAMNIKPASVTPVDNEVGKRIAAFGDAAGMGISSIDKLMGGNGSGRTAYNSAKGWFGGGASAAPQPTAYGQYNDRMGVW